MRKITLHHDGHGLNDALAIDADERTVGNASHCYVGILGGVPCFTVQFQHGPRNEPGSTPGCLDAALLAILIDRYEGFQSGPFASPEGSTCLMHLRCALQDMKDRADARAARGVLGKNVK